MAAAFALGLDFGHQHIRVAFCDLSGQPVVDDCSLAQVDHAPVESFDLAHQLVGEALQRAGVTLDQLLGVGMGLAAPINRETANPEADGILPGWREIRPATEIEARLGDPRGARERRQRRPSERRRSEPRRASTISSTSCNRRASAPA